MYKANWMVFLLMLWLYNAGVFLRAISRKVHNSEVVLTKQVERRVPLQCF